MHVCTSAGLCVCVVHMSCVRCECLGGVLHMKVLHDVWSVCGVLCMCGRLGTTLWALGGQAMAPWWLLA